VRCLRDHGVGFTEEYPDLSDCGARNWWARLHRNCPERDSF
jgi:hypothetical protein